MFWISIFRELKNLGLWKSDRSNEEVPFPGLSLIVMLISLLLLFDVTFCVGSN